MNRAEELAHLYLDGCLDAASAAEFEALLSNDPAAVREVVATLAFEAALRGQTPPADRANEVLLQVQLDRARRIESRVLQQIRIEDAKRARGRRWAWAFAAAAVIALAIGAAAWWGIRQQESTVVETPGPETPSAKNDSHPPRTEGAQAPQSNPEPKEMKTTVAWINAPVDAQQWRTIEDGGTIMFSERALTFNLRRLPGAVTAAQHRRTLQPSAGEIVFSGEFRAASGSPTGILMFRVQNPGGNRPAAIRILISSLRNRVTILAEGPVSGAETPRRTLAEWDEPTLDGSAPFEVRLHTGILSFTTAGHERFSGEHGFGEAAVNLSLGAAAVGSDSGLEWRQLHLRIENPVERIKAE